MLICTPRDVASSISNRETPLGVKIICSGKKPAARPNLTSWMETVSMPAPRVLKNFKIDILESAFTA